MNILPALHQELKEKGHNPTIQTHPKHPTTHYNSTIITIKTPTTQIEITQQNHQLTINSYHTTKQTPPPTTINLNDPNSIQQLLQEIQKRK